jgi:hypothetical protein
MKKDDLTLRERIKAKTPKFWKKVQRICIGLGVIGGAIAASPIVLPASVVAASTYLITAGALGAGLAQLTVNK